MVAMPVSEGGTELSEKGQSSSTRDKRCVLEIGNLQPTIQTLSLEGRSLKVRIAVYFCYTGDQGNFTLSKECNYELAAKTICPCSLRLF